MHYEYEYEVTDEVAEVVIKNLLEIYEKHKNIFKKILLASYLFILNITKYIALE
ncbi:hypothetical protein [Clostridium sp.]|uniref:hypothetical protein n=1 Tax=Clostridium sp. TaxID=1506 RepID=UPI0029140EF1|nr:hypothetical protein [Clostridium sp.]MDU6519336.1 hypothetical protein [Clostridium sp.]